MSNFLYLCNLLAIAEELCQKDNIAGILNNIGSVIYKGADVSEYRVKQLSKSGLLDDYKVLHFATHGLVGLTQSFLIAGANGLSVSLWKVADESTMQFMIGMYSLVQEQGYTYDRAITAMKRRFINRTNTSGTDYSKPFYWAPFVYYGK